MKTYLITILIALVSYSLAGQTTLKGKVIDVNGEPLEFVNVLVLSPADSSLLKGNVTKWNGAYEINDLSEGQYLLSIMMIGYKTENIDIEISAGQAIYEQADITLSEDVEQLEEVVVTAKKPLFEQKLDRLVVNVKSSITATGSTALEVLARSPGVRVDGINNTISLDGAEGVIIQINGKRSRIGGDALIQMLQAMPADNIEKIELISTPPASYDAEGVGGIINIVLIKNLEEGTNGNFSLNAGYGQRGKLGGSLNINMRKGKFNLFGDLSINSNYIQEDVSIEKSILHSGSLLETDTYSSRPAFRGFYNGRVGLDYNLSKATTFGVLFSAYTSRWNLDANTATTVVDDDQLIETSQLRSLERNDWEHFMANFSFRHNFENKAKISLDYDYLDYQNANPADYSDVITGADGELMRNREFVSRKENPINFHVLQLDYSQPISEAINIELGVKGTISDFSNDNLVADVEDGEWIINPIYTNLIMMEENVHAAYFSSDWQISQKTSAKAGLRYEYTDIVLSDPNEILTQRQFGRIFPSLFLSHNINDNNSLQFSYSERIQRPSLNALAPAFFFFSPNTLTSGNPQVRSSFTKQYRLSYRYKSIMFNVMWQRDELPMFWGQLDIVAEENLTIARPENMNNGQRIGAMVSFPVQVTKWWESRYEAWGMWQQQEPVFDGEPINQTGTFAGFYGVQTFNLGNDLSIEVDGYLQSGGNYGLAVLPWQGGFNVGVQKKFSNDRSITLNWQDAFNLGSFWTTNYNRPELNLVHNQTYQQEGSIFRLTYSQTFGNKKVKGNEQRRGASADERSRVQ